VLGALSTLRAGSASLLASAAQQLRLRQRTEQQNAASKSAASSKCPSNLSNMSRGAAAAGANGVFAEAPASLADMSRQFSRFAGQPGSSERDSGYCRQQQLMRWQQELQQQKQEEQQQQQQQQQAAVEDASLAHDMVDFLDKFTVSFMTVNFGSLAAAAEQGNTNSWGVPSRRESMRVDTPTTPAGTPLAAAVSYGSSSLTQAALQQHQLAVTYVQKPATALQQNQAGGSSEPEDTLTVFLAHLKVTVGPHTVSMLLQLLTSVTAAASKPGGGSVRAAGHMVSSCRKNHPAAAGASGSSSRKAGGSASRLHMQLQAALCHVRLNMERPYWLDMSKAEKKARAARASDKQRAEQQHNRDAEQEQPDIAHHYQIDDTPMRTKELLALLVLGTSTSVRKVQAPGPTSSRDANGATAAAAADAGTAQPGMEVALSVEHIGLQDLRACVEQRHVLSGALEPYQVRKHGEQHACCPRSCSGLAHLPVVW
jgi:hypothetical protein